MLPQEMIPMTCPSCLQPVCRCHPVANQLREMIKAVNVDKNVFEYLSKENDSLFRLVETSLLAAQTIDDLTKRCEELDKMLDGRETPFESKKYATAQERIKSLEAQLTQFRTDSDVQDQVVVDLQRQLTTLRAKVEKYGRHLDHCRGAHIETGHYLNRIGCTCGFQPPKEGEI